MNYEYIDNHPVKSAGNHPLSQRPERFTPADTAGQKSRLLAKSDQVIAVC
jgi:hypothetical protein